MKNKTAFLLTLALSMPLAARAQDDRAETFRASFAQTQERLNLTDEQLAQVEPIMRARVDASRAVMEKYGFSPESGGQGDSSLRQMRAMSKELEPIRKQADQELAEVLSKDQMKEYREIQDERRAQMRSEIKARRSR